MKQPTLRRLPPPSKEILMARSPLALAVLLAVVGTTAAFAQAAIPAVPTAPAAPAATAPAVAPEISINPAAGLATSTDPTQLLTGLYATKAVIELCAIEVPAATATAMTADQIRYERKMGWDPATALQAYGGIKTSVESTSPDCAEGSADRQGVDAVLAVYAGAK